MSHDLSQADNRRKATQHMQQENAVMRSGNEGYILARFKRQRLRPEASHLATDLHISTIASCMFILSRSSDL